MVKGHAKGVWLQLKHGTVYVLEIIFSTPGLT